MSAELPENAKVLIAFDKFKDSMSAWEAGEAAESILRKGHPGWSFLSAPLTDGGEGFCAILTQVAQGRMERVSVTGPRGGAVNAGIGFVEAANIPRAARSILGIEGAGEVAVIEMAQASGLEMLSDEDRDPWHTTTRGTGELIARAADSGASVILLGIGGSATNDLGLGALEALGLSVVDDAGGEVHPVIPVRWGSVDGYRGRLRDDLPSIRIACDVSNPLLGERGAAAVYGPQKGLQPADLDRMNESMERLARMLCGHFSVPAEAMEEAGAGAAGGIGFGLRVACGASYVSGFDLVSAWLDLETKLDAADLIITGEGKFDRSSLEGKGPGTLVQGARDRGKPVRVFAGAVTVDSSDSSWPEGLDPDQVVAISPEGDPLEKCLREGRDNLRAAIASALG